MENLEVVTRIESNVMINSKKRKVQLTNTTSKTAKESRTTDDLIETSQEVLNLNQSLVMSVPSVEHQNLKNLHHLRHKSNNVKELRSQTSLAVQSPGIQKIVKGSLKSILNSSNGDYNSVPLLNLNNLSGNKLDVVPTFHSQFKKNSQFESSQNIKISKQDILNFQKNGSLSKEFIHQNKKELESFIKLTQRNKIENLMNQTSAQEQQVTGLQYTTRARVDGSHLKKNVDSNDQEVVKLIGGLNIDKFNFNDDIRPEKQFQTTSSKISSKVIENWINSTLQDAEHLDIPSVILKQKNKTPINNYGIDKNTLISAGLSIEIVDRIYRSLFVYSVGFLELIKQLMSNCSEENSLTLVMNLWKAYCVLLEYSCKTDYQMFITRVTKQSEQEKQQIIDKFKNQIEKEVEEKKQLHKNMQVMQHQMEHMEKERNNEKNLRLKLEEEFMTVTRNHEEEVGLRLQFEARVNQLNTEYREIEIKYNRISQQLQQQNNQVDRLKIQTNEQNQSLIQLRTESTDNISKLESLSNFKQSAVKEIEKKSQLLRNAEQARKNAIDMVDTIKYQVQDQENQSRRLELRLKDLQIGKLAHENQIKALETQVQDLKDLEAVKQKQLETERVKFEELALNYSKTNEELQIQKVTHKDHVRLIAKLQRDIENFLIRNEDYEMQALIFRTQRDDLQREYTKTKGELTDVVGHLQIINKERHQYEDLYHSASKQIIQLEQEIVELTMLTQTLRQQNQKYVDQIVFLEKKAEQYEKRVKEQLEQKEKQINILNQTVSNQSRQILSITEDRDKWKEKHTNGDGELKKLETKIGFLNEVISNLKDQITALDDRAQRQASQQVRDMERIQIAEKRSAEAIKRQQSLEETTRYLQQKYQLFEDNLNAQLLQFQKTIDLEREQQNMIAEDAMGKYYNLQYLLTPEYTKRVAFDTIKFIQDQYDHEKELNQVLTEKNAELEQQKDNLEKQLDHLQTIYSEICEKIVMKEDKRFQEEQTKLQTQIDTLIKELQRIQDQLNFALEQNARLVQQLKEGQGFVKKGNKREDNSFDKMLRDKKDLQQKISKATQGLIRTSTLSQNQNLSDVSQKGSKTFGQLPSQNVADFHKTKYSQSSPDTRENQSHNKSEERLKMNLVQTEMKQDESEFNQDNEGMRVTKFEEILQNVPEDIKAEEEKQDIEEQRSAAELRRLRFKEYRIFIFNKNKEIFDQVQEKLDNLNINGEKVDLNKINSIPQYIHHCFKKGAEKSIPEQLKFLILSQEEKELLFKDYSQQLSDFQNKNQPFSDLIKQSQEIQNDSESEPISPLREHNILPQLKTVQKKKKSQPIDIFADFAKNHTHMLEKLLKENEDRLALEALLRRKTTVKPQTPQEWIQGRQEYQFLIKMARSPDFYEIHRNQYLEGLYKAQIEYEQKELNQERIQSEEQRIADEVAKILLDRRRAKLAKIVVERPYLQNDDTDSNQKSPNIQQIKYNPIDEMQQRDNSNIVPQDQQELIELQSIQQDEQLLRIEENFKNTTTVQLLIEKVQELRERQQNSLSQDLDQLIGGGVARVNRLAAINRFKNSPVASARDPAQNIVGNPSIRKKIRAAVSRII